MQPTFDFGAWLSKRRKALDLTRSELADRAGCSISALRKIEKGERRPSKQLAELLAAGLDISPEERPAFLQAARGEWNAARKESSAFPTGRQGRTRLAPGEGVLKGVKNGVRNPAEPARYPDNLPIPATPLVGRSFELATIGMLLEDPLCRWLTLVGPGGIGKTRLAIEAASMAGDRFPDGVCFIALAPLSSAELILPTLAGALGFRFFNQADPHQQLFNYLRGRSVLIVLDGAEPLLGAHLPEEQFRAAGSLLTSILHASPGVKLLVTSRERLGLLEEWLFEVKGLPVPSTGQPEALETFSAAALFLQSARRIVIEFNPGASERQAVARICQLVAGTPLAIELAAAWVRLLSCREIAQEIERSLDFLAADVRDLPARQRSLRAVFEYSWKYLSAEEQLALSRLSVFRGGFRRDSAEQLAGASLEILASLVGKSLLRMAEAGTYDLHELVRQYACEKHTEDPRAYTKTCDRHSTYYLNRLQARAAGLASSGQKEVLSDLNAEIDNLRAAWDWAVSRRQVRLIWQTLPALWHFYGLQGWFQEGAAACEKAIQMLRQPPEGGAGEALPSDRSIALGIALAQQGWFYFRLGRMAIAGERLRESVELLRPAGDRAALGFALLALGDLTSTTRNDREGWALLEESLAIHRDLDDPWFVSLALSYLAISAFFRGNTQEAFERFEECLPLTRAVGDPSIISFCLSFYGLASSALGKLEEARTLLAESLAMARASGRRWETAIALDHLGIIAQTQGDYDGATEQLQESEAIFAELGERFSQARALYHLGEVALSQGEPATARGYFREGLRLAREAGGTPVLLASLSGLARLEADAGRTVAALAMAQHLLEHPAADGETKEKARRLHAELQARLDAPQVEVARAQLREKGLERIIEEILIAP